MMQNVSQDLEDLQDAIADQLGRCRGAEATDHEAAMFVVELFREAGWRSTEELVHEACAVALLRKLWLEVSRFAGRDYPHGLTLPSVPVASVGPFGWLAEAVGERLASRCWCEPTWSDDCSEKELPPFAAVRSELVIGGKPWVEWTLVSAGVSCEACGGTGVDEAANGQHVRSGIKKAARCGGCGGIGEVPRTDVKAIADRYQPWRDEDTVRAARFRVRAD